MPAHQGHVHKANSHQGEGGDAEDRSDDDAPLKDPRFFAHES